MQKVTTHQATSEINYGGHTLSSSLVTHLTNEGMAHNVPPSLFISQLYYESNWGSSSVAVNNNNWGGLTWTGNPNRPSGIVVSRGTARPSNEGGYYMRFDSVEDYLTDYVYLLTGQGLYNVAGHSSFEDSVKGLFIAGGASANYAETLWQEYVNMMVNIRNGINSNNNGILDEIDGGTHTGEKPCFPTSPESVITSHWGWRVINGEDDFHAGLDLASPSGTSQPIYATQSGIVIQSGWLGSAGNAVTIKHSGDPYYSRYMHMITTPSVNVGDVVSKCQQIGNTGDTGNSYGIHLHFEIAPSEGEFGKNGNTLDPEVYLEMSFGGGTDPDKPKTPYFVTNRHSTNMRRMGVRGRR